VNSIPRVALWTEYLTEDWRFDADYRQRLSRGVIETSDLEDIIDEIREVNDGGCEGILFMQEKARSLQVAIKDEHLVVSDPQNPNYQNVKMPVEELEDFVTQYFSLLEDGSERLSFPVQILQMAFFLVVFGGVATGLYFISKTYMQKSSFLPMPLVEEIREPEERVDLLERHSAIYATGIRDGGLVIQLERNGDYRFYDMEKVRTGRYQLVTVESGKWRPTRQAGRVALVTDDNFVFYPDRQMDLVFLQRPFKRIAGGEAELPHVFFPE